MAEARAALVRDSLPIGDVEVAAYMPLRGALWVLVFLVLLVGSTWVVRRSVRSLPGVGFEDTQRRAKLLESFRRDGDLLAGVFIGTSRFYRGLDPAVFDRALTAAGIESRSINLSGNGVRMPETLFFVDWILDQDLDNLRWLVIELGELDPAYRLRNRNGARLINWHTTQVTLDCLDVLRDSERDLQQLWEDSAAHLTEWAYRQGSVGLGPVAFERVLYGAPEVGDLTGFNGFESFEELALQQAERDKQPRPDSKQSWNDPPGAKQERVRRAPGLPESQARILGELVEKILARGVTPIFVLMPKSQHNDAVLEARERGILPNLLNYTRPGDYPAFSDPALFWDASHFNGRGAELFSERLALDVARLLAEAAAH